MYSTIVWIALFVFFVVLESCTYQLICTWFAIGSAVAAAASGFGVDVMWQIFIFIAVSAVCLLMLRRVSLKLIKPERYHSNAESLVGKKITLITDADDMTYSGKAKVNGMEWSVRCPDGINLKAGSAAYVEKVEGVKLIVSGEKE